MFNLRTRTTMKSVNVILDDHENVAGTTVEDSLEGLLDIFASAINTDVVQDVTTSATTSGTTEEKEDDELSKDDDINDIGHDICEEPKIYPSLSLAFSL